MKVVQLGPYPPPHGGVQTNLVAIRDYLRRHGHACDAVNLTRFRREDTDGVYYPVGAVALIVTVVPAVGVTPTIRCTQYVSPTGGMYWCTMT